MSGVKTDISLQVKNTLDRPASFSLLGGTQDPSNGQANAKTLYDWDLTTESFTNTTVVEIEASTVDNPQIITYLASNEEGAIDDLQTVVNLLNTLNLGIFNLFGNKIWIIDDVNVFGKLSIKISIKFDIDDFVLSAYNYFDPNGKTLLADFTNDFKPSIESAVNNIPNFVENIETQGWSCCWVGRTNSLTLRRNVSGDVYLIGGGNPPILSQNTNDLTSIGQSSRLLYTANQNIYKECDITLDCLDIFDSNIFKFIFTGSVKFRGNNGLFGSTMGWTLLDPTYLQVNDGTYADVFGINSITRTSYVIQRLDVNYDPFPNLNVGGGGVIPPTSNIFSIASSNSTTPLQLESNELSFGTIPNNANFNLDFLEAGGTFNVNFSTLQLTNNFLTNFLLNNLSGNTVLNLDSAFNTKFATTEFGFKSKNLTFDSTANLSLIFEDFTTPLRLNFTDEIQWSNLQVPQKLPPIDQIGGYNTDGTAFDFFLNLNNQQIASTLSMGYYNDWFRKIGNQDWLVPRINTVVGGSRSISANGSYYLSGRGLIGLNKLKGYNDGFDLISVSANAEVTNSIYISTLPTTLTDFVGVLFTATTNAPPTINYRYSSVIPNNSNTAEYQTDVVTTSSPTTGLSYGCRLPETGNPTATETYDAVVILPIAFVDNQTVIVGSQSATTPNRISSFYCDDLATAVQDKITSLTINGLTITLNRDEPTNIFNESFSPIGLYNRNFKGIKSIDNISINEFNINSITINGGGVNYVRPYGSVAIFNFSGVQDGGNLNTIKFTNCNFHKTTVPFTFNINNRILESLFGDGVYFQTATTFTDCVFGLANNGSNPILEGEFNIFQENSVTYPNGVPALLGSCEFINVDFTISLDYHIKLNSTYNGVGLTLTSLLIDNCRLMRQLECIASPTVIPPPTTLTIRNNTNFGITTLIFENHNITTFNASNNPDLRSISLKGNALNSAQMDSLIIYADNQGINNGVLDYSNQTNSDSPTSASTTAYENLVTKGWNISGNPPPLSVNFNISTFSQSTSTLFQKNNVDYAYFNEDGTIFFLSTTTNYEKYVLGTAYILSSIPSTPTQSLAINSNPTFIAGGGQVWDNGNYYFNVVGGINEMRRWTFGTPNDLSTLGSLANSQTSSTTGAFGGTQGFTFSPTGDRLYILKSTAIEEYEMSQPYDLSTLGTPIVTTYASMGITISLNLVTKNLIFDPNGGNAILVGSQFVGTIGVQLQVNAYQFSLTTPYQTQSMSYDSITLNLNETNRTGVATFGTPNFNSIINLITLYNVQGAFPQNSQEFILRTPPTP